MVQAFSLSHSMSIFDYGIKDFVYILVFPLRLFNDKVIALLRGYVLWVEGVDSEKYVYFGDIEPSARRFRTTITDE